MVVLKRLARRAARRRPRSSRVIRGTAVNQDGREQRADGAQRPRAAGGASAQALAQRRASRRRDVDYVEAHGTGTALGDPIEVAGARRGVRAGPRRRSGRCVLGSVKTNIGHLERGRGRRRA